MTRRDAAKDDQRVLPAPGLYYPLADFRDESWFKLAILNWDQLRRIRPRRYIAAEHPWTRAVIDADPACITDLQPDDAELWDVGYRVVELIRRRPQHLRDRYGVRDLDCWLPADFGVLPAGGDPRLAYILAGGDHADQDKLRTEVAEWFLREGLALPFVDEDRFWLGMHPKLASVYMCALTETIAGRRHLTPVTDNRRAYEAVGRSTIDRLEEVLLERSGYQADLGGNEIRSHYVEVALAAVLQPVNLADVPIERILEFRLSHQRERRVFEAHLREIENDLLEIATIPNREEVELRLARL